MKTILDESNSETINQIPGEFHFVKMNEISVNGHPIHGKFERTFIDSGNTFIHLNEKDFITLKRYIDYTVD